MKNHERLRTSQRPYIDKRQRTYRLVEYGFLALVGPNQYMRSVAVCDCEEKRYVEVNDTDLVEQFDRGMEPAPWLDWLAERCPELAWAADLYARAMA